jgi:hypothetical protein
MRITFISEDKFISTEINNIVGIRTGLSGFETVVKKITAEGVSIQSMNDKDREIVEQCRYIAGGGAAYNRIKERIRPQVETWRKGFGLALIAGGKWIWVKVKPDDWVASQSLESGYLPPKVWRGWEHVSVIEPLVRRIEFSGEDYDAASWDDTHYHVDGSRRPWFAENQKGEIFEGSSPKELEALPKGLYHLRFYGTDNQGQYRWYGLGIIGREQYRYWSR